MNAVEVRDLVKVYRGAARPSIDGLSFQVAEGELFCLLGPNGAGKTTVSSILATVLAPTAGAVTIAGFDSQRQARDVRRRLGVVFQQTALDVNLTVEENLRLHCSLYGLCRWRPSYRLMPAHYRSLLAAAMERAGLPEVLHRPVRVLSGGTRRRVEIVRALLHRPALLLLDEPASGLDPESRRELWRQLAGLRRADRTTVVVTTHYLPEAEAADRVAVLSDGRLAALASPDELKSRAGARSLEDAYISLLDGLRR